MWESWLIVQVIMVAAEIFTTGFVFIWFAVGGTFAMITSFITNNIIIQGIVFLTTTIIGLIYTKKFSKKINENINVIETNVDNLIGEAGIVIEEITSPDDFGQVKVNGSVWTAKADKKIEVNKKVVIKKIEGVKLIVEEYGKKE